MKTWLSNTQGYEWVDEVTTASVRIKEIQEFFKRPFHFTSSIPEGGEGAEEYTFFMTFPPRT